MRIAIAVVAASLLAAVVVAKDGQKLRFGVFVSKKFTPPTVDKHHTTTRLQYHNIITEAVCRCAKTSFSAIDSKIRASLDKCAKDAGEVTLKEACSARRKRGAEKGKMEMKMEQKAKKCLGNKATGTVMASLRKAGESFHNCLKAAKLQD